MAKIRSKCITKTVNDKEIVELFRTMLGGCKGQHNYTIIWPKYKAMRNGADQFVSAIESFASSEFLKNFPDHVSGIATYAHKLRSLYASTFNSPDLDEFIVPGGPTDSEPQAFNGVPKEMLAAFSECYKALTTSNAAFNATVFNTGTRLIEKKHFIGNKDKLSTRFLGYTGGLVWAPIDGLSEANFKYFFSRAPLGREGHTYILEFLHSLYTATQCYYKAFSRPDIDVNDMTTVVSASLDEIRRQIPRCDEAFNELSKSLELFKNNFDQYYKDYIASDDISVMMQNFIIDVAQKSECKTNLGRLSSQFKTIIKFYQQKTQHCKAHPQMKALMKHIKINFSQLNRRLSEDEDEDGDLKPISAVAVEGRRRRRALKKQRKAALEAEESSGLDVKHLQAEDPNL